MRTQQKLFNFGFCGREAAGRKIVHCIFVANQQLLRVQFWTMGTKCNTTISNSTPKTTKSHLTLWRPASALALRQATEHNPKQPRTTRSRSSGPWCSYLWAALHIFICERMKQSSAVVMRTGGSLKMKLKGCINDFKYTLNNNRSKGELLVCKTSDEFDFTGRSKVGVGFGCCT